LRAGEDIGDEAMSNVKAQNSNQFQSSNAVTQGFSLDYNQP
jgi:hypothetical protein